MDSEQHLPLQVIRAADVGYRARQAMAVWHRATVLGSTSRGLFLQGPGRWLIFLSYERYRSPLTVTVADSASALHSVEKGDAVLIQGQRLTFLAAKAGVILTESTWRPAAPSGALRSFPDRVEGLKQMAVDIVEAGRDREMGLLLRPLLSLPGGGPLPGEQRALLDVVIALQETLRNGDGEGAAAAAGRLLGRGRGLTASGDDFLVGLLLFANRHPAAIRSTLPLDAFSQAVVDAAYEKTTTLSANLIECAADGHSDERLLAAADSIATGTPPGQWCLSPLMGWGASSGVDALAGMACAATL